MTAQRINFYQAEFQPVKVLLPLAQMLKIVAGVTLLVAALAGYLAWTLQHLQKEQDRVAQQAQQQQATLQRLNDEVAQLHVQPELEAQNKALREEVANQGRLLASLQKQSTSHSMSFSHYLDALMDHHLEGVWITELSIDAGGTAMHIKGETAQPELLPQYIDGLKQADILQGMGFALFDLHRDEASGRLLFELSSHDNETDKTP